MTPTPGVIEQANASSTVIFVCGVAKGKKKQFRCPCCGFESNNLDSFATTACWPCSGIGGGNLKCKSCRELGVWVDRFSSKAGKGHRMRSWTRGGHHVITACGQLIPRHDIGQATAVREPCRRCWPEEFDTGATRGDGE